MACHVKGFPTKKCYALTERQWQKLQGPPIKTESAHGTEWTHSLKDIKVLMCYRYLLSDMSAEPHKQQQYLCAHCDPSIHLPTTTPLQGCGEPVVNIP